MATYYWVGGNGTWDSSTTTNWALSSGGSGGAGFPTSADSVIFDSASGAAPVVTITAAVCSACTIGAPTSGTLTLAFGASTLTMAGNLTVNTTISVTGTGTITLSSAGPTFAGNGNTFYNVTFSSASQGFTYTLTGSNTYNNLTFTSPNSTGIRALAIVGTHTVNGVLTIGAANTAIRRILVVGTSAVSPSVVSLNGSLAALADVDFRDLTVTGTAGTWTGTRLGNCGTTSGITFDAGKTVYWNLAAGGNWTATAWALSSGAGVNVNNFPLAQDTAIIENTGLNTSATITIDNSWAIGTLNCSTRSNAMTLATGTTLPTVYGSFTLSSSVTLSGTSTITFRGTSTQAITSAGVTFTQPITINNYGGSVQLRDNLTVAAARTTTLTLGTLDLTGNSGNWTLSTGLFSSTNSNVRSIVFGTGNITLTGVGTVWTTATPTNFSYTGTPTVNVSNNSATATTVSTGAMTGAQALNFSYTVGTYTLTDTSAVYKNLNFTGFTGTIPNSTRTIYGSATFVAGMTLTAGGNVTTFAATSGINNITFAQTWNFPITFNGIGGTWAFQDAMTQGSTRAFTITNGTVQLKAGATSTVGSFATSGVNQKFLQSTISGTQATLSQASGTVNASYLTIKDINATGGATWNSYVDQSNVDAGNVDGWNFGISPVIGGAEYTYQLRSFTQLRRF